MKDCNKYVKKLYIGLILVLGIRFIPAIDSVLYGFGFLLMIIMSIYGLILVIPWFRCFQHNRDIFRPWKKR